MRLVLLLCCSIFFLLSGCTRCVQINVGNTKVLIQQEHVKQGKNFIHLHQNETTALEAARRVMRTDGGSLLTLKHPGARNIVFYLHNKRYEFDPNRIFSDSGIKKTLKEFGPYTPEAHKEVKKLADKIKLLLPPGKIIAVHNNRSYSFLDYLPGHHLACDAQDLYFPHKHQHRNFYLVTQRQDYVRLKNLDFNSIWQANTATNDGSLSIYLANKNYINVEAGYDQLATQIKMLRKA